MRTILLFTAMACLGIAMQTDQFFTIGTAHLQIGQEQQAVLNYLGQLYEIHNTGGETWVAAQKNSSSLKKVGVVTFEGGRLVTVGSTWDETYDPSAVFFAQQLVAAVRNQQLTGPHTVVLRPLQTRLGGVQTDGFELLIGSRTIQVITSTTNETGKPSAQYATVMENLHDHNYVLALAKSASR